MKQKYVLVSTDKADEDWTLEDDSRGFGKVFETREDAEREAKRLANRNTYRKFIVCVVKSSFVAKVDIQIQETEEE